MSYTCSCCGRTHEGLPDVAFDRPVYAHDVPEGERAERVHLTDDLCVLDGEDHFIRGVIEIPIPGHPETLGIGVWVSQKSENYRVYVEHFDSAEIGPFFGWLSNEIEPYAPTLNLKTMAHFRAGGLRPSILLEPTEHPLAVDQREGISLDRAWEIVHAYLDPPAR